MILLLLALLAPSELSGAPGADVVFDAQLVGAHNAQISASHPLVLDTTSNGSRLHARISPDASPGRYDAYIYAAPISDDPVVVAAAQPVTVQVRNASRAGVIASTRAVFNQRTWWLTPVLVIAGLAVLWVLGAYDVRLS